MRRIYPNKRSVIAPSGELLDSEATIRCLEAAGWVRYDGPAVTDDLGYVIAGTDPRVVPQAPLIDPDRMRRRGRG